MALFSRRTPEKPEPSRTPDDAVVGPPSGASAEAADAAATGENATGAAPTVGISLSAFRGLGAEAPVATAPAAPTAASTQAPAAGSTGAAFTRPSAPAAETVPGLRDNVLLRDALAWLPEAPTPEQVIDAARQLLQGHLFLRVKGDVRALIAEGSELPLASATIGDRRFAVAYSSGQALADSIRHDGDQDTTAMGQPVLAVLRHVIASSADGLIVDPASAPRRIMLPRDLVERTIAAADDQLTIKTLLAGERTAETAGLLARALAGTRTWAAVGTMEGGGQGLAEGRSADGARYLEVYSHPLEVVAMGRGDQPTPIEPAQLAAALRSDEGITGVVLDSRGPWARLTRVELAPVLALAEAG